jgi:hypothetical protein
MLKSKAIGRMYKMPVEYEGTVRQSQTLLWESRLYRVSDTKHESSQLIIYQLHVPVLFSSHYKSDKYSLATSHHLQLAHKEHKLNNVVGCLKISA